jgi:hypothetical protein
MTRKLETPEPIWAVRYRRNNIDGWDPWNGERFAKSFQPVVMATGIVCAVSPRGATLVRHAQARMWVFWAENTLPPGVAYAKTVSFIGHLQTFNVGAGFHVIHACLLSVKPNALLKAALQVLPDAVVHPKTYLKTATGRECGRHQTLRNGYLPPQR